MRIPPRGRRVLSVVLGLLLAASVLSACGSTDSAATGDMPAVTPEAGAYPVTVEHRFGATTIEQAPKRIAVVGYADDEYVLAFGAVPVLTRKWFNDQVEDWKVPYLQGKSQNLVDLGSAAIPVEKVVAAKPDLIIGVNSAMTQQDYDSLSKIAPVIAPRAGYIDYGMPWQDKTRQIGAALGQPAKAEQLIGEVEAKFTAVRAAHPEWAGRTAAVATYSNGQPRVFGREDGRSRFFQNLGFRTPTEYDALTGDKFFVDVSLENARLLDQDLLIWDQLSYTAGGRPTITGNPSLAVLAAMRENRAIYLENSVEKAFGWQTILSIPVALDGIVPLIEQTTPRN
ncbi:ABC transporter substrate-binding protein [Nocardia sp. NPDC050406]|uniref:ABC transporter substrate-binding protein n=1 Tax=Nocardia sp. NPDC050406 TaxID=3364318 RepID=UPI003788D53F